MRPTGKIIVLAFPDTYVTMSDEFICKLLPLVGLGTREYIKAGHAAIILIENSSGHATYYDFGRYITPTGYGRVRSAHTDAELEIPFAAELSETYRLQNLDRFLKWIADNPDKTHGNGRLVASVCDTVDYKKAMAIIERFQSRANIPYGAFTRKGSNCSRFVTDTLMAATSSSRLKRALRFNKLFTPSTVGNVEKAATNQKMYELIDGDIQRYKGSAFKENILNYFDKARTEKPGVSIARVPPLAQKLEGIGSSAWFELVETDLPRHHFRIRRYNEDCITDFDGVFYSENFEPNTMYRFTYDSHCAHCHVIQNGSKIQFKRVATFAQFAAGYKSRSA